MQLGLPEHLSSIRCGFVFPISCFWSILDLKLIRVWVAKIKCDVFVIIPFAYQQTKLKTREYGYDMFEFVLSEPPKTSNRSAFFSASPPTCFPLSISKHSQHANCYHSICSTVTQQKRCRSTWQAPVTSSNAPIAKQNRYNGNPDIPEATTWLWVHLLWHQDRGLVVGCGPPFHIFFRVAAVVSRT